MTFDKANFEKVLATTPIIAIIRGVTPEEAVDIARAIHDAGVRIIETPMNSPQPLDSLRRIKAEFGDEMIVGVGTVLKPEIVDQAADAGAEIIVAPNTRAAVIRRAVERGAVPLPGFATAS
ncbi:MAG TPA: 2-dehydro-3-deoxy-6-phosphogalactonate aldolase, partial [Caulobacteraceae bacterium]|nr:2-dehydro-3-deoxy-6-phosphogalactonate aldolase [Caulobacteraceae bacterium]